MAKHKNREAWLYDLSGRLVPLFKQHGAPIPKKVRIAIAFPSTGARGKRIGECWDHRASRDGHFEIMLRPDMENPLELAATLAHELVHAAVGLEAGHGKAFRKVALAIGLEGKMKATTAGPALVAALKPILKAIGPVPHASLNLASALTTRPKKQTTRLIKCMCDECGYAVRVARKWIDDAGAPICPTGDHGMMVAELPDDDNDDNSEGE